MNKIKEANIFNKDVYYSYIQNEIDFSITPLVVGFERCRIHKPLINSNKPCYIIHYVVHGEGTLTYQNKTYKINKNNLFILPPHSNASYRQSKNNPWLYIWLEISGANLKSLLEKIHFSSTNFIYKDDDNLTLKNIFQNMINDDNNSLERCENLVILEYIFKIFSFLIKNYNHETDEYNTKQEKIVNKICEYLYTKFDDPYLSIDDVAKQFYFTQSYLCRLFKKQTGITPIQYIDELRMKKAIELLNHKDFTIEQIAETLGYTNQFYFAKRFKKYYGMPPSKYKQKNME